MKDRVFVMGMIAYIEKHLCSDLSGRTLVARSGYSLNRLRQKFFNVLGETPSGYIRKRRLTEASKEILQGAPITEAALKYGYSSQDNFTTAFRSYFQITPGEVSELDNKYKRFVSKLREAYSIMEITNLKQPPFCTTLMGCINGAFDYYDKDLSPAMLYGLSGHAFLINIHQDLCPSSPYVWNHKKFYQLLGDCGIKVVENVQIDDHANEEQLKNYETQLKEHLNQGRLCILNFFEHQLISGYDEAGLIFLQPWQGSSGVELQTLTFGSWKEAKGKDCPLCFQILEDSNKHKDLVSIFKDSLHYARQLYRDPHEYTYDNYKMGFAAYDNWIQAVEKGMGGTHGNWWSASVWAECRKFASDFFQEMKELLPTGEQQGYCDSLSKQYKGISSSLEKAKDKEMPSKEKTELLQQIKQEEKEALTQIEDLLSILN